MVIIMGTREQFIAEIIIFIGLFIFSSGITCVIYIIKNFFDKDHRVFAIALLILGSVITIIGLLKRMDANEKYNNEIKNNIEITEAKSVTEPQSVKTSAIKVAILNKYNGAEIISSDKSDKGYFIYEQEKYSYELDNNILFINKDNKTVDYLYVN